jgi:hypothetical protein
LIAALEPIDASWPTRGPDLDEIGIQVYRRPPAPDPAHRPTNPAYDLGFIIVSGSTGVRTRKGPLLLAESIGGAGGPQACRTLRLANVPIGGDSKGVVQRTVYMIAEATTEEAPLAPLFAAMAAEIHGTAARIGQASASGRLDPPLLMGLVISSLRRAVFNV